MLGIGSKPIAVVLHFYFDMVGGPLLGSSQALNMRREVITTCDTDVHQLATVYPTEKGEAELHPYTYLALGPAHSLQHLLAKFGVVIAPGAVPGVNGPLLFPPGCRDSRNIIT